MATRWCADSSAQFGIVSARHAAAESGLLAYYDPAQIAIVTGCACGGRAADEDANRNLYLHNARVPPTAILRFASALRLAAGAGPFRPPPFVAMKAAMGAVDPTKGSTP